MSINLKNQTAGSVLVPPSGYTQLFIEPTGPLKLKDSTGAVSLASLPGGGTVGQLLAKQLNGDADWVDPPQALPLGGTTGQVLAKASNADGDAIWRSPSAAGITTFPYLQPPSIPDAWDLDASTMTDPDLANNGWTCQGVTNPWPTFTRSGDIDLGSFPAGNTYRSTLVNGQLWIQLPFQGAMSVSKAGGAGYKYKMRIHPGRSGQNFAGTSLYSYSFISAGGSQLNKSGVTTSQVGWEVRQNDSGWQYGTVTNGSFSDGGYYPARPGNDPDSVTYFIAGPIGAISPGQYHFSNHVVSALGGTAHRAPLVSQSLGAQVDTVGVFMGQPHASMNAVIYLDFIRRQPYNGFFDFP